MGWEHEEGDGAGSGPSSGRRPAVPGPLEGVRVLEFTSVVLGPYAGQMLGDLGADVVKVEPPTGDSNRRLGPYRAHPDMAALFLGCNRNKRSVVLDLKQEEGRRAALDLARGADAVIHNFRPRAMTKLGLDYPAMRAVNRQIVYCATYGYGKGGPYGDRGALDDSIQAISGIAMLARRSGGEPGYLPTIVADKTAALVVVQAVLAALFHRERTGRGQEIEVPMFETIVSWLMTEHLWGLTFEPPLGTAGYPRLLSEHRRPYATRDGYLAVLPYWDKHWATFCRVAGREDLLADPRFADMQARLANIDATYAETAEVIATRSTDEWLALLAGTSVPHMRVADLDELLTDPHLAATGFWELQRHPTEGTLRMPRPPVHFGSTPASIRRTPPRLGEHSVEVLGEAGYDAERIARLLRAGVTRTTAPDGGGDPEP